LNNGQTSKLSQLTTPETTLIKKYQVIMQAQNHDKPNKCTNMIYSVSAVRIIIKKSCMFFIIKGQEVIPI
jgi:hypothetical protein